MPAEHFPHRAPAVLAALVALVTLAPAQAAAQTPPDPTARFSWAMPERASLGWRAWSERRARYRRGYVRPASWAIDVNACTSSGSGSRITSYEATVAGVGFDHRSAETSRRCRLRIRDLPRLGSYDVTLVVRTATGPSRPETQRVELRDFLVVSLGDSMASGEGVPDRSGLYESPFALRPQNLGRIFSRSFSPREIRPVRWQDRRCHRSARSGHARAARTLERRDRHSSVTFLSLACSGAEIAHLVSRSYEGIQPPRRGGEVDPQVEALARMVGRRRVDALLLAVGVNDLGFSSIIERCAVNLHKPRGDRDCVYGTGVRRKLDFGGSLERSYAGLARALRRELDVAEVYITDYPAAPFGERRGCGLLATVATNEAQAIYEIGQQLYWAIGRAAAENGWNWVPGMTQLFERRHYCASRSFLVRLETSLLRQGSHTGALHPDRGGSAALGRLLVTRTRSHGRIVLGRPALPHKRATLVVEQVRVEPSFREPDRPSPPPRPPDAGAPPGFKPEPGTGAPAPPPDSYAFDFSVREIPFWVAPPGRRFSIPHTSAGQWVPVPAEAGTFQLDVWDPPRPPRYPTEVDFLARGPNGTLGGVHPSSQDFGAGCHERRHPTGWAIRYRIVVEEAGGPPRPPGPAPITNPCAGVFAPG